MEVETPFQPPTEAEWLTFQERAGQYGYELGVRQQQMFEVKERVVPSPDVIGPLMVFVAEDLGFDEPSEEADPEDEFTSLLLELEQAVLDGFWRGVKDAGGDVDHDEAR